MNHPHLHLSTNIGPIHFSGIGGIGMSGIAEILHNLGYKVQGSDLAENANTQRLKEMGVTIFTPQEAQNINGASVVVRSSAVKNNNPEIIAARADNIPVILRADMLAEIMRLKTSIAIAGTHGKTTTTSLVTAIFAKSGIDPTVINGGILNAYGTNARLGQSDWLIAEADESDGTFLRLPATVGVITNIDPEHMEHYGDFDTLKKAFRNFIEQLPFYGFGVLCADHPVVDDMANTIEDRTIITYGINNEKAMIRAINIESTALGSTFDVAVNTRNKKQTIGSITLPMPGIHNILNSLAAIAIGVELDFNDHIIKEGLAHFEGVKRRFTKVDTVNNVTIIDDYAHHPTEIKATLDTAVSVSQHQGGKLIAVVQPHRYSRLNDLFEAFADSVMNADTVIITSVFAAGEQPIDGVDHASLAKHICDQGHKACYTCEDEQELASLIHKHSQPNDLVVCMGAGSISKWAYNLPEALKTHA